MSFTLSKDLVDTVSLRCGPIKHFSLSKSSKGKQCLLVPAKEELEDRIVVEADDSSDSEAVVEEVGPSGAASEPVYDSTPEESFLEGSSSASGADQEQPSEEEMGDTESEGSIDSIDEESAKFLQHPAIVDAPVPEQTMQSVKFGADLTPTQLHSLNLLLEEKRQSFPYIPRCLAPSSMPADGVTCRRRTAVGRTY